MNKTDYTLTEAKALFTDPKEEEHIITFNTSKVYVLEQDITYTNKEYPYGFKRTDRRVFIETTKRGDRLVTQTLNPSTQKWNAEKKSTYAPIKILVINTEGKNSTISLDHNDSDIRTMLFKKAFTHILSDKQKIQLAQIDAYQEVMQNVTWDIKARKYKHRITGEISQSINIMEMNQYDECDENGVLIDTKKVEKEQKDIKNTIDRTIATKTYLNIQELKK